MKTWSLSIVAVLLVACSGGESTGTKSANEKAVPAGAPPAAIPVSVAAAIERDVQESDEFSGRLEAFESVEIRSRVSGVIQSVHFQAGREVRRGDLLFTVDARAAAAELAKADAELARQQTRADLARTEFARSERLLSSKAISQQEFDQATATQREAGASIRAAQAQVDAARLQVEFTRVTAPINGR